MFEPCGSFYYSLITNYLIFLVFVLILFILLLLTIVFAGPFGFLTMREATKITVEGTKCLYLDDFHISKMDLAKLLIANKLVSIICNYIVYFIVSIPKAYQLLLLHILLELTFTLFPSVVWLNEWMSPTIPFDRGTVGHFIISSTMFLQALQVGQKGTTYRLMVKNVPAIGRNIP